MTVGTARGPASARTTGRASPRPAAPAVTRIAVRQVFRGTAVVTLVCGGLVTVVVTQYRGLDGAIGLSSLSSLADNPAIRTLFGRADALDDPGGFTVWRTGTLVAVLVGTWAVLTATRLTRGEEEAGRWELLLAGRLPLRALVLRTLAVVLAAAMLPGVGVALGLLLAGTATTGAVLYGAAVAGVGLTGAALGVLAAQLLPERRAASGLATVVFLAGLLARMVADGVPAFSWLHWVTPFGLLSRTAAFAENRFLPLALLAALAALFGVAAVALAGRRDVGAGRLATREHGRAPSRLLRSLPGFAVHRTRRPVGTWGAGHRRVLPAHRPAGDGDDGLPAGEPALRRVGRAGRLRAAGLRRRLCRLDLRAAGHSGRCVRLGTGGGLRARRERRPAGTALLASSEPRPLGWLSSPCPWSPDASSSRRSPAWLPGSAPSGWAQGWASPTRWPGRSAWSRSPFCASGRPWRHSAGRRRRSSPSGCCPPPVATCCWSWPTHSAGRPGCGGCRPSATSRPCPVEPFDVAGALGMLAVALLLAVLGLVGYHLRDLRG